MSGHQLSPEERLGELLSVLPPAPDAWVEAAKAMPAARIALDRIHERIVEGAEDRAALTADLEAAIARTGQEPTQPLVRALRQLAD